MKPEANYADILRREICAYEVKLESIGFEIATLQKRQTILTKQLEHMRQNLRTAYNSMPIGPEDAESWPEF